MLKEQLHAKTGSEHWFAVVRDFANKFVEPETPKRFHRCRKSANSGHDQTVRLADCLVIGGQQRTRARLFDCLLNRSPVADAVIGYRDRCQSVSVPLVLGTPVSV